MLKIGHITTDYRPIIGGAEVYLDELIGVLRQKGFEQTVYQLATSDESSDLVQIRRISFLPKYLNYCLMLPLHFSRLFKEDLLIINYPQYFLPVFLHKRSIILSHGATWTSLPKGLLRNFMVAVFAYAYSSAKACVFNDTFVLREIGINIDPQTNMFRKVDRNKWFIPNCVDTSRFSKLSPDPTLLAQNLILVPRNITYGRGIDLAVKAFAVFNKVHPETKLGLVGSREHLGKTQDEYVRGLLVLIDQLGLNKQVLFLGHYKNAQMPLLYSSSLMSIIPTRHREGTSLSALESMACGTATLSTNVEGLLDLPTYKCEPSPESMAEAMLKVFMDRETIAEKQMLVVRETFKLENWRQAWLKVIQDVVGQ